MEEPFKKQKQRGGRPSKLTVTLQETICKYLLQGIPPEEAIRQVGISRTTFWRYRKNPSFARAIDEAWDRYWKEERERFMAEILEKMRLRSETNI